MSDCDCGACGVTGDGLGYIWCGSMSDDQPDLPAHNNQENDSA